MTETQVVEVETSSNHESGQDSVTEGELQRLVENKRAEAGVIVAEKPSAFEQLAARIAAIPDDPKRLEREQQCEKLQREVEASERRRELIAGAGNRYVNCSLENFKTPTPHHKTVVAAIDEYRRSLRQRLQASEGLVLYGPVGTGKDHLAYAVASYAANHVSVKWVNGQEWFGQIRDAMDGDRTEAAIIYSIKAPAILVVSDPLPPVGDLTQHQATMLYRAIESRYAAGKITITTINVADDEEADRRMGAATWDRLCHGAWKVHCKWASYRKPSREVLA